MLYGCSSLSSLPDISKWNTNKVGYISGIYERCSSLSSLPNYSKWNANYIPDKIDMFKGCSSLSSLPDISILKTYNNNIAIKNIPTQCENLILPKEILKHKKDKNTENFHFFNFKYSY